MQQGSWQKIMKYEVQHSTFNTVFCAPIRLIVSYQFHTKTSLSRQSQAFGALPHLSYIALSFMAIVEPTCDSNEPAWHGLPWTAVDFGNYKKEMLMPVYFQELVVMVLDVVEESGGRFHIWGTSPEWGSVLVRVSDFQPYFYMATPVRQEGTASSEHPALDEAICADVQHLLNRWVQN